MLEGTLTVTQLTDYLTGLLIHDPILRYTNVVGELHNVRVTQAGHCYFSLCDESASLSCAFLGFREQDLSFVPEDGMQVQAEGRVSFYAKQGTCQLYITSLVHVGKGNILSAFDALKHELTQLGYFDTTIKKSLPFFPRYIGIVTSHSGAVLHDIKNVIERRCPAVKLLLAPSTVQGENAAREIVQGIETLCEVPDVDVIIVARGGGSQEDLAVFNNRNVLDAIFHCKKPVISAVGHETDVTLADFVADVRAPTPSAAAEIAVPALADITRELGLLRTRCTNAFFGILKEKTYKIDLLEQSLQLLSPVGQLRSKETQLQLYSVRLRSLARNILTERRMQLESLCARLHSANPHAVLQRGYTFVEQLGGIITRVDGLVCSMPVAVHFYDGIALMNIDNVRTNDSEELL